MLKFWVAKGVVNKKLSKGSTGKTIYSLSKTYLNKPLGKTVLDYKGRKTYAERLEAIQ